MLAEPGPDVEDFYPDTLASTCWRGVSYGAPAAMAAELLVYRTDFFARSGLQPPRTTEETLGPPSN